MTITLNKDRCRLLQSSCDLRPTDVSGLPDRLSPKVMFAYMRALIATTRLPVAIVSPVFSLQVRLGRNRVPQAGETISTESKSPAFYLIPYPVIPEGSEDVYNADSHDIRWVRYQTGRVNQYKSQVLAIHAADERLVKLYDPTQSISADELILIEGNVFKIVSASMRKLLRPSAKPNRFTVVSRSTYSTFSSDKDSAYGVTALAECFATGSTARLRFDDFDMVLISPQHHQIVFRWATRTAFVSSLSSCSKAQRCSSRRCQER